MSRVTSSPSAGKSEVLISMADLGQYPTVARITREVASDWHRATSLAADVLSVLQALATDGKVTPSPSASTDHVALTASGRVAARAPRPRATMHF